MTIPETRKVFTGICEQLCQILIVELGLTPARIQEERTDFGEIERDTIMCAIPENVLHIRLVINAAAREMKVRIARIKRNDSDEATRIALMMKTHEELTTMSWIVMNCLVEDQMEFLKNLNETVGVRELDDKSLVLVRVTKQNDEPPFLRSLRKALGDD
jgi:hypothetical protein